jgi:hypothetical protein
MTAVYFTPPIVRTLSIASSNPSSGVSITVSPLDNNQAGNGTTPISRLYNNGAVVNLTAPGTVNGNTFQKWQKDGVDAGVNVGIAVTMDANHTMTAVYATPPGPLPPSNLTATAVAGHQINLAWRDNSANETSFRIERKTGVSGTYAEIAAPSAGTTSYQDLGLAQNTTYYYRVRARNANGNSAYSNEANATTLSGTRTLTFTSVGAEDGYLTESSETSNSGGSRDSNDTGSNALRVGDATLDRQIKSIVSFDTSALPDGAVITSVSLRLVRSGVTGSNPFSTYGTCHVDIKSGSGFGGSTALTASDYQAAADVAQVASLSNASSNGSASTGTLNSAGRNSINRTGKTQFRIYFQTGDNDDQGNDYIGYYSGENATAGNRPLLTIVYE